MLNLMFSDWYKLICISRNPSFLATDSSEIAWPQYNVMASDTNPQFVKFTTTLDSESIGDMSYVWWPTTNFWNSIDALAYPEEDGEGSEEGKENHVHNFVKKKKNR